MSALTLPLRPIPPRATSPSPRRGRRRSRPGRRGPRRAGRRRSPGPGPSRSTASEWFITTSMSCSTKRKVTPSSVRSRCMWSSSRRPSVGLIPAIGSSSSRKRGLRHQRPRQLEQLALAAGEGAGVVVGQPRQVEQLEQLHRLLAHLAPRAGASAAGRKITFDQAARRAGRGAASIMLSITGIAASALVIWKVRTMPEAGDRVGRTSRGSGWPAKLAEPAIGPVEAGDRR